MPSLILCQLVIFFRTFVVVCNISSILRNLSKYLLLANVSKHLYTISSREVGLTESTHNVQNVFKKKNILWLKKIKTFYSINNKLELNLLKEYAIYIINIWNILICPPPHSHVI